MFFIKKMFFLNKNENRVYLRLDRSASHRGKRPGLVRDPKSGRSDRVHRGHGGAGAGGVAMWLWCAVRLPLY